MKKNILLSLLFVGFAVFILFFARTTYQYYQFLHSDDPIDPYVRVMEGLSTIVRGEDLAVDMGSGEVYDIIEGDIIITKPSSYALINWPDRSKTRVGPNSRLTVKRMRVAVDYSSIEIELAIEKGKIWTNVVRTIYPGSYFRANLPSGGIIAGVRGTIFDINLDLSYIRSVDHSITLTDSLGHIVSLLPGEAVNATNILEKISSTLRDRFWTTFNSLEDSTDSLYRTTRIEENLADFKKSSSHIWGRFVQSILSWFDAFHGLDIMSALNQDNIGAMANIPTKYLLEWYQHFQDTKFVQQRESIRMMISEASKNAGTPIPYIESLARGALWDSMAFSGITLESARTLVGQYASGIDSRIQNVLQVIPIKDLEQQAKETLRSLLR